MADYLRDKYYPGAHTFEEMDAMDKARKLKKSPIEAEVRMDNKTLEKPTPTDYKQVGMLTFSSGYGLNRATNTTIVFACSCGSLVWDVSRHQEIHNREIEED